MSEVQIPRELLVGFLDEAEESLASVEPLFVQLETRSFDKELLDRIFRPIHSIKGNAAYFGLMRVKEISHRMESVMELLRQGRRKIDRETLSSLLRGLDALGTLFSRARQEQPQETHPDEFAPLCRDLETLATRSESVRSRESSSESAVPPDSTFPADSTFPTEGQSQGSREPGKHRDRSMRIPEASMDHFLEQIGELMGLEEQFRYLGKRLVSGSDLEGATADLRQAVEQFGHLSTKLSGSVLELRRIEARPLLQKVVRICRDLANATGKSIDPVIQGEDVRIDKSYLELLDAPLVHMVRNSCDHGLEPAAERIAKGKPPMGTVAVSLSELDESVVMEVTDDGRGLDLGALRRKGIELGLVREDASFTENDAIQILFRSGVSTATSVTEISGRGVGMDVVKREIEGAGGRIDAKNRPGLGCTFLVTLPRSVTTRITDGFLFRCGTDRFVIPMKLVIETFTTDSAVVSRLPEGGETVLFRGKMLRLVQPLDLLDTPTTPDGPSVFVRIKAKEMEFVLRVEEVLGVQRTVIKPMEEFCRAGGLFAGAALVGDGGLALVASEDGLANWLTR
ncbi:MAG: Hpt domain-containing protein [Fibrobacteres bacterium]|nr:Hpt domain-containing protein [Fibrobacterota bacterium]